MKEYIKLTGAEIQAGISRVDVAESLIWQLPETHEGRNTWLLNYGVKAEAREIRKRHGVKFNFSTLAAETTGEKEPEDHRPIYRGFLHRHPKMEHIQNIDTDGHVIVDREDWEAAREMFNNPNQLGAYRKAERLIDKAEVTSWYETYEMETTGNPIDGFVFHIKIGKKPEDKK